MNDKEHLQSIIRHIKRVEDNCNRLAQKLYDDDTYFAISLIKRGRLHDASKFDNFEFYHLRKESKYFRVALDLHRFKNSHHPEHWDNGINDMKEIDIAEMVCDCVARGQEFGTDSREWFINEATKLYDFKMDSRVGELITKYLNLLLTPPFS